MKNLQRVKIFCFWSALLLFAFPIVSLAQERTRILFLLDASLSMKNQWKGGTKWDVARNSLCDIADSISHFPNVEIGVRVFGHLYQEPDKNCYDSKLEVRFDTNNEEVIRKKLNEVRPKGITPLVYSIEKGVQDFGGSESKNIIIVITDGEDACDRDPCSVIPTLQKNNIFFRPFIIGMSLQAKTFQDMICMGKLFNTSNSTEFAQVLHDVVTESVSRTTLQVNLNDAEGKPIETNVAMTFYDLETEQAKYNFYHTLNSRGLPDTLVISPALKYKLQIHTIPPIIIGSVELKKNSHSEINVSAPQGYLNFTLQGLISKSAAIDRIRCLVHSPGETETLNVQDMFTKEKYLTGTYDLEIMTLPRTYVKGVKIGQSKTTEVQIPSPGILTLNKSFEAYGGIFEMKGNRLVKIYELHLNSRQETIAIQPGKYRIVYRSKNARTIHTSVDKEFEITSGGSLSLRL